MIIASSRSFDADRDAWRLERERIDLAAVATNLLGPAAKRIGGRLWWVCRFHEDRNPSLSVETKPGGRWKCWGCGAGGDAAELVMRLRGVGFPEAREFLTGAPRARGGNAPPRGNGKSEAPAGGAARVGGPGRPAEAAGLPHEAAAALVEESAAALWTPPARAVLDALRARGIGDGVLRMARVGCCAGVELAKADGTGTFRASGTVIPWFDERGRLLRVKLRQPPGAKVRYLDAHRSPTALAACPLYLTPAPIAARRPVAIVEGELDALCLATALGGAAAVVSGGNSAGCRKAPSDPAALSRLLRSPRWFVATDADDAGDDAASTWTQPRAVRVRPEGAKDWSDLVGVDWPGMVAIWARALSIDEYDLAERAAIRWESELG